MTFKFETLDESVLKLMTEAGLNPVVEYEDVPRVKSGSLAIDWATSGGYPRGRYTQIYGEEGAGKSTLFFIAAATLMRENPNALVGFVETGGESTDPMWIHRLGIDMKRFVHLPVDSTEEALNALITMRKMNRFDLLCLDSIAAMASQAEVNMEMGDTLWAMNARLLKDYFNRESSLLKKAHVQYVDIETGELLGKGDPPAVILINQMRESQNSMGDPERITGGRALKHALSLSIRVSKPNMSDIKLDDESNIKQMSHKLKVRKNKVGPPFRTAEYEVVNNKEERFFGIDPVAEMVTLGKELQIIEGPNGGKWVGGTPQLNGEPIELDNNLKPPKGEPAGAYRLRQKLRQDDDLYLKLYVALVEYIAQSRYDDSIESVSTVSEDESIELDIMPEAGD